MDLSNRYVKSKRGEEESDLFMVMETLEVVLPEKRTVLGLATLRHALAKVHPEIVATPFVAGDSPAGSHCRIGGD